MSLANSKAETITQVEQVRDYLIQQGETVGLSAATLAALTATLTADINAALSFEALEALQLGIEEASHFINTLRRFAQEGDADDVQLGVGGGSVLVGAALRPVSAQSSFEFEISTAADLDEIDAGTVITVDGTGLLITLKEPITSDKRFNIINGGRLTIRFRGGEISTWTYSGTATFVTANTGTVDIKDGAIHGNASATLFDVTAAGLVAFDSMTALFFGSYGTIRTTALVLMEGNGFFAGDGFLTLIDNGITAIASWGLGGSNTPVSGALVRVSGPATGFFDFSASNIILQSGEIFIRFDPDTLGLQASIDRVRAAGGLFDTTGGATGTFTATADASVALTTIDSVTDSSGVARFNFTVGPTLFVGQQVDIINFVTETSYNQTGFITAVGAGFFEIASIAFTADDATGDFSGDSVTMTETGTALVDGDTLIIDTTDGTQYDGGATVYNQLVNSFQINRVFSITRAGTWDTAGIDQSDPRVLATKNAWFVDSKYIATAFVNDNSTANGAIVNNTFTDMVFGTAGVALIAGSSMERWKLVDEVNGIFEYTGAEPFDGRITFDFTVVSSGGTVPFRFKWEIDTGSGFGDLPDAVEALAAVGSDAESVSKTYPLKAVKGDQIRPQLTRNSGSSGITTSYATIYATQ